MPRSSRQGGKFPLAPLAACASLALLAGLLVLLPNGSRAYGADSPQAVAGIQTTERLVLSVTLPAVDAERPLTIELFRGKKVVATPTQKLTAGPATQVRVPFEK